MLNPAINSLPQFLRDTGYVNPTDVENCAFHRGHQTKDGAFEWLRKNPEHSDAFFTWMKTQRDGKPSFMDAFNFEQELAQRGLNLEGFVGKWDYPLTPKPRSYFVNKDPPFVNYPMDEFP